MLKKGIPAQLRDAVLKAAQGSELIAAVTGEPVTKVLARNLIVNDEPPPKSVRHVTNRSRLVVFHRRNAAA